MNDDRFLLLICNSTHAIQNILLRTLLSLAQNPQGVCKASGCCWATAVGRRTHTLFDKVSGMYEGIESVRAEYKNPLDPATE